MERQGIEFNPSSYSDMPLYNIQAVSAATGVPAITLRSWERRYGIPQPHRDDKGYRLYSERDIAVTRWLKDRVQRSVGISRAVNMLRAVTEAGQPDEQRGGFNLGQIRERLADAAVRLDEVGVSRLLAEGLMVAPVEDVALDLIQPALYEIGNRWAAGDISVTVEHFASNIVRGHLAQLVRISPEPLRRERVVVGCAPGELHDIGALVLTLILRRRGFGVAFVGASVEPEDFVSDVARLHPAGVLVSASRVETALGMIPMLDSLTREYSGLVVHGGRAFDVDRELIDAVPGTYLGGDARVAVSALESTLVQSALSSA